MIKLNFKANVGLKNVVGQELINNDNIAIIELIKNAKDAGSGSIEILFSNAKTISSKSRLVIQDFGDGMSLDDITNKWLNIAFSDKRDKNIKSNSRYAGSKGIGRFSCDRLGQKLDLYTKVEGGELICLHVNWPKFEIQKQDAQISSIDLYAEEISAVEFTKRTGLKRFSCGTVLDISCLRSIWDEDKIVSLRKELERFVMDPSNQFDVILQSTDFAQKGSGKIANKVFEKLDFKTTSIIATISPDGEKIMTTLRHDGHDIFTLTERNSYKHLRAIKATIFYLNQPAKALFRRETGYRSIDFGSIFLFINSFRVFPYGDYGDDWLALDRRKQQGQRRYLGNRELVGTVEITDAENVFQAVSSREGLVRNQAYMELAASGDAIPSNSDSNRQQYGFLHRTIRKLEKFVVDGLDWHQVIEEQSSKPDEFFLKEGNVTLVNRNAHILSNIEAVIRLRSPESDILDTDLNTKYLLKLAKQESGAYEALISDLQDKLKGKSMSAMSPADKRDLSKFIARQAKELKAKEETNRRLSAQTEVLKVEKIEVERKLDIETKKRLFSQAATSLDLKHVVNMHHQIGLIAGDAYNELDAVYKKYSKSPSSITPAEMAGAIERSMFFVSKIKQASKFATKANFDMQSNKVKADVVQFLEEYIKEVAENGIEWGLKIKFDNPQEVALIRSFRPIELAIIADNLISNAKKARAKEIAVKVSKRSDVVHIKFIDNGDGIDFSKHKAEDLFEIGITTTRGSGIGLHHVSEIAKDLKATVSITNNKDKGACVELEFQS